MVNIGDVMKGYEDDRRLPVGVPIIARLDGKNFHAFTRGMERPYDSVLTERMIQTTETLAESNNAVCAYTQSDEISLTWLPTGDTEVIYGGKIQKIVSILAAECSTIFNGLHGIPHWSDESRPTALFDCRVFALPDQKVAAEYFLWRKQDAYKNSVAMLAQAHFSPKQLHGLHIAEQLNLLRNIGINHQDYKLENRFGTFIKREKSFRRYSPSEIQLLPPLHKARTDPNLEIERHDYKRYYLGNNFVTELSVEFSRWLYDVSV